MKGKKHDFSKIKLFLSDVDGVLTDAGMYYTENGDEFKKFCTYDGIGFQLLQKTGIKVGILTTEDRELNRRRAKRKSKNAITASVSLDSKEQATTAKGR